MSWFNEFEWFFMVLLIMKWALMWAVAACVSAAGIPCEEYCACILSGDRNVLNQPNCDCTNRVKEFREQLEGSSIYYEPAEYLSLPAFIYEQPFYIVNPHAAIHEKDFNRAPTTQIEINIDSIPNSHRRKEKDIHINDKKHTSIYLDIDVEPEDSERSASNNIITIDDLKLTEESLRECANLHTVLDYRKRRDSKLLSSKLQSPFDKYDNLLDDELINRINNKCSQISDIVEKSLNEIKEKRPKKTTSRMHNEEKGTYNQQHNDNHMKSGHMDTSEKVQTVTSLSEENLSDFDDDTQKNEHTVVIYTDNETDENITELHQTISVASTVTSTKTEDVVSTTRYLSSTFPSQNDLDVLVSTTESVRISYPAVTPTYIANEYALDTETTKQLTTVETLPSYTLANISTVDRDVSQNNQSNHVINDFSLKPESSNQREEKDAPLLKIITHEFKNSIESYINGTEEPPNREFEDGISNETDNSNTLVTEVSRNDIKFAPERIGESIKLDAQDISGHLYFLYNQHHIPAKFVQKPTGSLHLGIDGATLCDKLTQDDKHKSALIKTLCDCYKSDNCITRK